MLSFDSRLNNELLSNNLPIWSIKVPFKIPVMKLEEEEGNSYEVPDSKSELKHWWKKFYLKHKYPLYCTILATEADENISLLVEYHREELSKISGDKCCFVYFRDFEKAKLLDPFHFVEHSKAVMQFIKIIEVPPSKLPCILFFEEIISGEYVCVGIEGKTVGELVKFLRELFTFIYLQREVSLSTIRKFRFSKRVYVTKQSLIKNMAQLGKDMAWDLIKSLVKLT